MKFQDGLLIGAAAGLTAAFFFSLLTELVVVAALVGVIVWRISKWKTQSTLSTEKKSPSSYL